MNGEVENLIKNIQNKITIEGKKRVFEDGKELKSEDLKERQNPEEFTREFLIDKILFEILKVERTGPKNFDTTDGTPRMVDYAVKYEKTRILIEAKPINANLYDKSPNAAVNQIIGVFRLAEARDKFDFGIATDGLKWIFISTEGNSEEFDIQKDFNEIKKRIIGEEKILQKIMEDISKKFYVQYNDLIHGVKRISKDDCLVNSILHVDEEDREEIAQVVIDRLIFIKFLEAKGIIKEHVLDFLYGLEDHELNLKLNQLFFEVMSTKKKERGSVDPHFEHIPYLNGSLFEKFGVEKRNPNYKIRAKILHKVVEFLNKFKFIHRETLEGNGDFIDPEILGYIFERAMNATDRKGTGAYYTPKEITRFIAENTIYPNIIDKVNKFLIKKKGYKKTEIIKNIDELFILRETTLSEIWTKIILKLSVCDNACGSGAFLLAAANVLFNLNKRINDNLGLRNSDIALKKLVLKTIYGVDINPRAIEIALLRLWLWLVESYKPEYIEPLPNIEYNLRVGNTLIGYVDIEQFGTTKITLDDFIESEETTKLLLNKFRNLKTKYQKATGNEARELKNEIESIRIKINKKLDKDLFQEIKSKGIDFSKDEFLNCKPFHWGFEFYEIFDLGDSKDHRGFDVIIGNPPYIRVESLDHKLADIYKSLYDSVYQRCDIYVAFIETSYEKITKEGRIGLITANQYIVAEYGKKIREILSSKYFLHKIIDFTHYSVFPGITIYNAIIIGGKKEKRRIKCIIFTSEESIDFMKTNGLIDDIKHKDIENFHIDSNILKNKVWLLKDKKELKIIDKIKEKANIYLKDLCLIGSPLKTGRDSILYQEVLKEEGNYYISSFNEREIKLEKELWGRILKPRQLNKWTYENAKGIIFFPYKINNDKFKLIDENSFKNLYPKTYQFLSDHKEILLNRIDSRKTWKEHGRPWYSLHRLGVPKNYFGEKIITQSVTKEPMFCLDKNNYFYPCGGVMGIVPFDENNVYWLLAYLNSPLIYFFLKSNAPVKRGGYISLDVGLVSDILIPEDNEFKEKLTTLCKQIYNKVGDKKKIEKLINNEIYNFFNIKKEEIEIIEKSIC